MRLVPCFLLTLTCKLASAYEFGVAKSSITDGAHKPILQGFADSSQETTGVHDEIYARAFVIKDDDAVTTVIVVMDNWSGTDKIKRQVIHRVGRSDLTEQNFLLTATHSHAAPGGYSDWKLYEHTPGGFDMHNFECIVSGVVRAVEDAFENVASGNIYITEGDVSDAPGAQRSPQAYNANPLSERNQYSNSVDTDMLLLKFTRDIAGQEETVAVLNWHAINPTNLGQDYSKVSGDNKGYAEFLFEQTGIIAAFANSNAGDVSGNVVHGVCTGKTNSVLESIMQADGQVQYDAAVVLEATATTPLSGGVDYRYTRVDMGNTPIADIQGARTWPGGLGLSFAAGSKEDGVARVDFAGTTFDSFDLREGITVHDISAGEFLTEGAIIAAMALQFGIVPDQSSFVNGHLPKPLILRTGVFNPPLTPNVVPLQIIKIGQLAIVGVPGEPTTMAGRRIKETVQNELGVSYVAVTGYSNENMLRTLQPKKNMMNNTMKELRHYLDRILCWLISRNIKSLHRRWCPGAAFRSEHRKAHLLYPTCIG